MQPDAGGCRLGKGRGAGADLAFKRFHAANGADGDAGAGHHSVGKVTSNKVQRSREVAIVQTWAPAEASLRNG